MLYLLLLIIFLERLAGRVSLPDGFMEFNRIDDSNVECIITQDDMEEFGIDIEDLLNHKPEGLEFIHDVINRAQEEAGFKPANGMAVPMQVSVGPDKTIKIMLTEDPQSAAENFIRDLKEKAGLDIPENILEELSDVDDMDRFNKISEFLAGLGDITIKAFKKNGDGFSELNIGPDKRRSRIAGDDHDIPVRKSRINNLKDALDKLEKNGFVFAYGSMSDVIRHSRLFAGIAVRFKSSLYHNTDKGVYYLKFVKGNDSMKHFATVFRSGCEFGEFYGANPIALSHLEENSDIVIEDKAVQVLRKFK